MTGPIWRRPISDQARAVQAGQITAGALASAAREQIVRREDELRAWTALSPVLAPAQEGVDDPRRPRPLRGVSVAVKDLIDVAGLPTRCGSAITAAGPAATDAACVARLRELGAVIQGKTATTEFGYFKPSETRNPHSPHHTPGGSSSGSAAAVGAGVVPLALGTQTAGSTTRPASFCGTAAMVLAHGATDLSGITGLSGSLDSLGFLTRTVEDLITAYTAFTGIADVASAGSITVVERWRGSGLGELHPAMRQLLDLLGPLLTDDGLRVDDLDCDDHVRTLTDDHATIMAVEAADTLREIVGRHREQLSAPLVELVDTGAGIGPDAYEAALVRRDRSRSLLRDHLADSTIIVGPAALGPAPAGLSATGSPVLSRPWQLLGYPAVTVPGARTDAGLPLGVQLIAPPGRELELLAVARRLQPALTALPELDGGR